MAMEQNYIDSEYESKLEFQSMWDDLKNKVQRGSNGQKLGEERKMLQASRVQRNPFNQHNKMPVATVGTPIAFCTFLKIGRAGG